MAGRQRPPAILFDLDGTLTDPFVGITTSIGHAMMRMGYAAPAPASLRWCIGPPLQSSLRALLASDDEAVVSKAVDFYRERYAEIGKFENELIEGIPELLAALAIQGYFMVVATSKLGSYAGDIVSHFGLMPHFRHVYGSERDGRNADKADLIAHILSTESIDPSRALMVGDREHDIVGAHKNGVRAIGVTWGYAEEGELLRAGADALAESPAALGTLIQRIMPPG